jgi:hypothetical protein
VTTARPQPSQRVGAENAVITADLVSCHARLIKLDIRLRERAGSGTVSTRVTTTGLYGSTPRIRLARPARPVRPADHSQGFGAYEEDGEH